MKLRSLVLVSLVAGLSLTACGDDDDSGGGGTGGSGTGGSGTGGSGTGGTGGGGGNMTPEAFCASYETHCGFGTAEHYPSSAECKTKYAAFSESRKTCANTHLAMAADKTSVHCTHAAGAAPCN